MMSSRMLGKRLAAVTSAVVLACVSNTVVQSAHQSLQSPQSRDAAVGQAQPPAAGTAVIGGTITSLDGGRAVRRARVTISGGDTRVSRSMLSDDQGAFSFTQLGPGDYTLAANKPGYLDTTYGQRNPGSGRPGTPISITAGQKLERIGLQIARGAVITGVVRDDAGEPAFGTQVRALRYVMQSGERTLRSAGAATVDDRGIYRIGVLLPGEYILMASPRDESHMHEQMMMVEEMARVASVARTEAAMAEMKLMDARLALQAAAAATPSTVYAPVYYPSTLQGISAQSISVAIGEERANVDFQLQLVPTVKVTGTVLGLDGSGSATVQAIDRGQFPGYGLKSVRTGPDGKFTLNGLTPGQYTLIARSQQSGAMHVVTDGTSGALLERRFVIAEGAKPPAGPPAAPRFAMSEMTLDGREVSNVTLMLQDGVTVSGSVTFDTGGAPAPNITRLAMTLAPVGQQLMGEMPMPQPATVDASGRFTIRGVFPGRYRVVPSMGVPPGYTIKTAVFSGRDSLDVPLEIRLGEDRPGGVVSFGTKTSEITGVLQDPRGQPATDYTVVLFAADPQFWTPNSRRVNGLRPSSQGRFSFKSLPAGDYRLVAVTDIEPGQWYDPEFLRQLVGASISISVTEGEKKTQDVRVR